MKKQLLHGRRISHHHLPGDDLTIAGFDFDRL